MDGEQSRVRWGAGMPVLGVIGDLGKQEGKFKVCIDKGPCRSTDI